jgi:hypothetical protein
MHHWCLLYCIVIFADEMHWIYGGMIQGMSLEGHIFLHSWTYEDMMTVCRYTKDTLRITDDLNQHMYYELIKCPMYERWDIGLFLLIYYFC